MGLPCCTTTACGFMCKAKHALPQVLVITGERLYESFSAASHQIYDPLEIADEIM
ncbi:hypothetical protein PGT21_003233 [Puccinia graminis f. sp. tritici]|uniref:Uncharacterized protein n=1 Tax=Puccinia graminis f. sp. tritici TaxID=56615 RepID=A0A5B0PPW1_PUCGR|nr:hypothetical protein PGT21_003233 [Puccinia graminis f. sp. tritici]